MLKVSRHTQVSQSEENLSSSGVSGDSWQDGGVQRGRPTSHLSLQAQDHLHGLLQDDEFSLSLVALQVQLTHAAELPEGFVNVPHAHPLPSVIGHASLALALLLLLHCETLLRHAAVRGDQVLVNHLVKSILYLN